MRVCFEEDCYQPLFHTKRSITAVSVVQPITRLCYSHRTQPRQLIVTPACVFTDRERLRGSHPSLDDVSAGNIRNTWTAMIERWSSSSTRSINCSRGSNSLLTWQPFHYFHCTDSCFSSPWLLKLHTSSPLQPLQAGLVAFTQDSEAPKMCMKAASDLPV